MSRSRTDVGIGSVYGNPSSALAAEQESVFSASLSYFRTGLKVAIVRGCAAFVLGNLSWKPNCLLYRVLNV